MPTRSMTGVLALAKSRITWISFLVLLALSACGGGSSGTSDAVSPTPAIPLTPEKLLAPAIVSQPVNQSVQAGQTVTFFVAATGDSPLTYQWRRNGVDVAGANAASYGFVAATADNGSTWSVKVSNAAGSVESASVTLSVAPAPVPVNQISLVAGSLGGPGNLDGVGREARFNYPKAVVADSSGNVYVLEQGFAGIRRISPTGQVTHLPNTAGLHGSALSLDSAGNLYVAGENVIRKYSPSGIVSDVAGKQGNSAVTYSTDPFVSRFGTITGLVIDGGGNIYVADLGAGAIRKISSVGVASIVAEILAPVNLAFDGLGNLYVASRAESLRKIMPDGRVSDPGLGSPNALSADRSGNIYISYEGDPVVRRIASNGQVTQMTDWPLTHANLAFDGFGNVYKADQYSVGKYSATSGSVEWAGLAATGPAPFSDVVMDSKGGLFTCAWVNSAQGTSSQLVRTTPDGTLQTFANVPCEHLAIDRQDNVYVSETQTTAECQGFGAFFVVESGRTCPQWGLLSKITPAGATEIVAGAAGRSTNYANGPASQAGLGRIVDLKLDSLGNLYFIADGMIRKISTDFALSTVVGLPSLVGSFQELAIGQAGEFFVSNGFSVWKVSASQAPVLWAGSPSNSGALDGTGAAARFGDISSVVMDLLGNVFVADRENNTVRKISPNGTVTTIAGRNGSIGNRLGDMPGSLDSPSGLILDGQGNLFLNSGRAILKLKLPP